MSTAKLLSFAWVGLVAAACGGNVSLGNTGNHLSGGDGGPGAADGGTECASTDACGPPLRLANTLCADGSMSGPTGRCLASGGTCKWEVRQCPDAGVPACFDDTGVLKPEYKTCKAKGDCVVETFQRDCCGTMLSTGVNVSSSAAVQACAKQRTDGFPGCGCAAQGGFDDDGVRDITGATASVDCVNGQCKATFDKACGSTTCASDQTCCSGVPFSTPTCVSGPSCPISQRKFKTDIHYLEEPELARLNEELMSFRLTTYRYKNEPEDARRHLGFIIDDVAPSAAVEGDGTHVDLYGYASMSVAALKMQAREIADLKRELAELKATLRKAPRSKR